MKLLSTLFDFQAKNDSVFDTQRGKTLAEYQQELLVKMGKRQFEKLQNLGLSIPVQLA